VTRVTQCLIALLLLVISLSAQQRSPLPELPSDIPKDAVIRMVLMQKTPTGQDAVWQTPDGAVHELFQFNDRGRGPKIYTTYRLDANGLITSEESKGVNYMKSPVEEYFSLVDGKSMWKNQSENETQAGTNGKFFIDLDGGPESSAILARALLIPKNNGKLPVLPGGAATIRKLQSVPVEIGGKLQTATLYEIVGLAFTPSYVWLDEHEQFFATVSEWSSIVRGGFESVVLPLLQSQQQVEFARAGELAKKLTVKPVSDLIIRNVTVFESQSGRLLPDQRITVRGQRIAGVEREQGQPSPLGAQVIDGSGKMLLPGLWDMHAHLYAENSFLDIASGVTTARDLGNPIEIGRAHV